MGLHVYCSLNNTGVQSICRFGGFKKLRFKFELLCLGLKSNKMLRILNCAPPLLC